MAKTSTYSTRRSFLGVGWKFPIDLDRRKGVAMSQFEENIEESILIILGTALGERVRYASGVPAATPADAAALIFIDGSMREAPPGGYELLDLDRLAPVRV